MWHAVVLRGTKALSLTATYPFVTALKVVLRSWSIMKDYKLRALLWDESSTSHTNSFKVCRLGDRCIMPSPNIRCNTLLWGSSYLFHYRQPMYLVPFDWCSFENLCKNRMDREIAFFQQKIDVTSQNKRNKTLTRLSKS